MGPTLQDAVMCVVRGTGEEATPGPWMVACESGDWFVTDSSYKELPATMANAVLQAAAPNLLIALRNLTECAEAGEGGANMDLWIAQARHAIAAATGSAA